VLVFLLFSTRYIGPHPKKKPVVCSVDTGDIHIYVDVCLAMYVARYLYQRIVSRLKSFLDLLNRVLALQGKDALEESFLLVK
jgi:hypothetical protein